MNNISYSELFSEYYKLFQEKSNITIMYIKEYINSYNKLNDESRNKLFGVFNEYLNSYQTYKKVLNFMVLNNNKIAYDNATYILDLLDEQYEEILTDVFYILQDYDIASNMRMDHKFNPNKDLSLNSYDEYINYIKGFNMDNIFTFLINNNIYNHDVFEEVYSNLKVIDCDKKDYYIFSGINDNGEVMVPKVKDELSTLINIHELVHKALLLKQNFINDDRVVNSEVLPVFYELLYKKNNKFCNEKIHDNLLANKLIEDYNNEPFNEQVIKLKLKI